MIQKVIRLWRLLDYVRVHKHTLCIQNSSTQIIIDRAHITIKSAGDIRIDGRNVYLNCDESFVGTEEEEEQVWLQQENHSG